MDFPPLCWLRRGTTCLFHISMNTPKETTVGMCAVCGRQVQEQIADLVGSPVTFSNELVPLSTLIGPMLRTFAGSSLRYLGEAGLSGRGSDVEHPRQGLGTVLWRLKPSKWVDELVQARYLQMFNDVIVKGYREYTPGIRRIDATKGPEGRFPANAELERLRTEPERGINTLREQRSHEETADFP
ncbi:predicted protein [Verticillium alfalfae VaMs.102]|uniref:Predicted protein n=1 Tax=Verticillium alfalfae (strain VaMs.102 / ATCC MYA-4576 / FGSC 10136) TaxID=526221 RepID=C9SSA8_VERA1|nr:predicted protein [Verticillium alfalfae VaMs.102]EEY21673.1 predicted protein [Verticillium alfalfae VaMs.102]